MNIYPMVLWAKSVLCFKKIKMRRTKNIKNVFIEKYKKNTKYVLNNYNLFSQ